MLQKNMEFELLGWTFENECKENQIFTNTSKKPIIHKIFLTELFSQREHEKTTVPTIIFYVCDEKINENIKFEIKRLNLCADNICASGNIETRIRYQIGIYHQYNYSHRNEILFLRIFHDLNLIPEKIWLIIKEHFNIKEM